jgi:hypothetical protein
MDVVWQGDVRSLSQAKEFLCAVDQIYELAISQHWDFVTGHLVAWLDRYDRIRDEGPLHSKFIDLRPEWSVVKYPSCSAKVPVRAKRAAAPLVEDKALSNGGGGKKRRGYESKRR